MRRGFGGHMKPGNQETAMSPQIDLTTHIDLPVATLPQAEPCVLVIFGASGDLPVVLAAWAPVLVTAGFGTALLLHLEGV